MIESQMETKWYSPGHPTTLETSSSPQVRLPAVSRSPIPAGWGYENQGDPLGGLANFPKHLCLGLLGLLSSECDGI